MTYYAPVEDIDLDPEHGSITYYAPMEDIEIEYVNWIQGYRRVEQHKVERWLGVEAQKMIQSIETEKKTEGNEPEEEEEEWYGSLRSWGSLSYADSVTSNWRLAAHERKLPTKYARKPAQQESTFLPTQQYEAGPAYPAFENQNEYNADPSSHQFHDTMAGLSIGQNSTATATFNEQFYPQAELLFRNVVASQLAQLPQHVAYAQLNTSPTLSGLGHNTTELKKIVFSVSAPTFTPMSKQPE